MITTVNFSHMFNLAFGTFDFNNTTCSDFILVCLDSAMTFISENTAMHCGIDNKHPVVYTQTKRSTHYTLSITLTAKSHSTSYFLQVCIFLERATFLFKEKKKKLLKKLEIQFSHFDLYPFLTVKNFDKQE